VPVHPRGEEATGAYRMPVWKILSDGDFELIVANAAHIKNVPGHKTDLQRCHVDRRSGGVRTDPSELVPQEEMQELRALMRTRNLVLFLHLS
jgi:transposase